MTTFLFEAQSKFEHRNEEVVRVHDKLAKHGFDLSNIEHEAHRSGAASLVITTKFPSTNSKLWKAAFGGRSGEIVAFKLANENCYTPTLKYVDLLPLTEGGKKIIEISKKKHLVTQGKEVAAKLRDAHKQFLDEIKPIIAVVKIIESIDGEKIKGDK